MTDVMAGPLATAITLRGGEVLLGATVEKILLEDGRVTGVEGAGFAHRAPMM